MPALLQVDLNLVFFGNYCVVIIFMDNTYLSISRGNLWRGVGILQLPWRMFLSGTFWLMPTR